jgi:hypothetical protein
MKSKPVSLVEVKGHASALATGVLAPSGDRLAPFANRGDSDGADEADVSDGVTQLEPLPSYRWSSTSVAAPSLTTATVTVSPPARSPVFPILEIVAGSSLDCSDPSQRSA